MELLLPGVGVFVKLPKMDASPESICRTPIREMEVAGIGQPRTSTKFDLHN